MSITPTKDGKWRVRVYAGFEGGRRRLIDKMVPTEREAKKLEAQLRSDLEQKRYVPPTRKPLAEYLDEWLARADVKPRTRQRYEQLVRVHVKPVLGSVPLSKLGPQDVAELLASMRGRVSDRTRLHTYRALHRALELARKWKLIPANPCDDVEPPRCNEAAMRILSPEEERLLLAAARGELRGPGRTGRGSNRVPEEELGGVRLYALYLTALRTGMRLGELAGLRWCDVSFEEARAYVRQTLEKGGLHPRFGSPKNRKERPVPLPAEVVEVLKELRVEQELARAGMGSDYQDFGLVFAQVNGHPLDAVGLTRRTHRRLLRKAGLPKEIRFHDLRHTFVSRALAAGANPRAVSEVVGHFDAGFTLRRYAHALEEDRRETVERVAAFMNAK